MQTEKGRGLHGAMMLRSPLGLPVERKKKSKTTFLLNDNHPNCGTHVKKNEDGRAVLPEDKSRTHISSLVESGPDWWKLQRF